MTDCKTELLDEAIARNAGMVLSLPSAGMLRHHKSRFLGDCSDGIWVESAPQEAALVDALAGSEKPCGVSFKSGSTKVVFSAPILRRDPAYHINAELVVEAVLIGWPTQVKSVQRRSNYRVKVPDDYELSVRVWRMGKEAHLKDRPIAAAEVPCRLIDMSVGGIGVYLAGSDGNPPQISCEDRLRIELMHNGEALLIEGLMRYPKTKPQKELIRAGLQFLAMENDMEGRRQAAALTRIVGELQRLELRRFRLGLA